MIRLLPHDDASFEVRAEVRLGSAWGAYQAAIRSAGASSRKLSSGLWQTTAPLEKLTELEAAVRHLGLEVSIDPTLAESAASRSDPLELVDELEKTTGMRLLPFQRDGVVWLAGKSRGLLLDSMGLGKTPQALMALPEGARTLVVCPAAVKAVWSREAARFRPELDVAVLSGRGSFRWPEPGELLVTNYELLPEHVPQGCPEQVIVIADESHAFKSSKARRTQLFRHLAAAVRVRKGKTWLLTGTPLTNRPPDLWNVLRAAGLAEATFGTWAYFAECFGGYQKRVTATVKVWEWGTPRGDEVAGRLRAVSLRRHKADVLTDLPPKRREVLTETELGARDRKALDRVWTAIEAAGLGPDPETGRKVLPTFEGMSEARRLLATAKVSLLESIVEAHEDAGEPLVVWSAHRAPLEGFAGRPGWGVLTGDVSLEERGRLVERFQAGELLGLACTIAAAGVGLTMTRASREVFVDLDWTPALNAQAEDRLYRIGQESSVLVTVLAVDHPLDKRILELCAWKESIFEATVGASAGYVARIPTADELAARDAEKELRRPRPAATEAERWAERALLTLSAMDPDGAREVNAAGWNRIDGAFGHRLAARVGQGLSDAQWAAAVRTCRKYWRQVGPCPEERLHAGEVEYVSRYPEVINPALKGGAF